MCLAHVYMNSLRDTETSSNDYTFRNNKW